MNNDPRREKADQDRWLEKAKLNLHIREQEKKKGKQPKGSKR